MPFFAAAVWAYFRLPQAEAVPAGEDAALSASAARVFRYLLGGVALVELALGALYREPGSLAVALGLLSLLWLPSFPRAHPPLYWAAVALFLFGLYLKACP